MHHRPRESATPPIPDHDSLIPLRRSQRPCRRQAQCTCSKSSTVTSDRLFQHSFVVSDELLDSFVVRSPSSYICLIFFDQIHSILSAVVKPAYKGRHVDRGFEPFVVA